MYTMVKVFEWDKHNKEKNWKKHKVEFRECEEVFFNLPIRIFQDLGHSLHEARFVAFGRTHENRWLMISFTLRENKIRIISARDQSRKERRKYAK